MRLYKIRKLIYMTALATITGVACSDSRRNDNFSNIASDSAFDPKPDDTTTIEAQTKRYKGQTKFLNPGDALWDGYYLSATRSEDGQDSRDIQESDIFKIGPENSKLLYLLNNYRGLQVVSYSAGPESPVIEGRVPATGNWPDDMYFDEGHERLLVLENIYTTTDTDYYDYSSQQSRLLTYDVSNSSHPALGEAINLQGRIRDSRMVGSVLYVATSVRPSYADQRQGDSGKGYVYAFSLTGSKVEQVDMLALSAPVNYGENMNIVETKEGDQYKYYLVAVLADYSNWSWFGKKPIEVIDISDPKGKIKPMMVVESKGNVSERSQTQIKNGALIVTSNFANQSNLLRIAVESFILPTDDSETITAFEAEYRKVAIEREVKKLRTELTQQGLPDDVISDRLKELKEKLSSSGELALKGLFVEADGQRSSLSKLMPDDVTSFGSTQGLNARLQDVRYEGDLLYAFWVPANNIDPFDVVSIADPKNLTHLSHLEFDGWIQRAIPLSYAGKSYVIGLGWIIPRVDNDDMRRYPQAILFEAKKNDNGTVETKVVSQKNLSESSVWANFNTPDKYIELRMTSDTNGMLMYPFSSWSSGSYTSGGQLVGIDLSKIESDPANVFTAGSIVKAEESWLRRIFNNPEIDRINTFTDLALGTYNVGQNVGSADTFVEAANVLELARNIVDYVDFSNDDKAFGIQIVSSGYWWSRDEEDVTFLRLVGAATADAELNETLATMKVSGSYLDSTIDGHRLLLMTQTWKNDSNNGWKQQLRLFSVDLSKAPDAFVETASVELGTFQQQSSATNEDLQHFLKLRDGSIVAAYNDKAFLVGAASGGQIQVSSLNVDSCITDGAKNIHFHEFDGRVWAHFTEKVDDPEHANYHYDRHFVSEVSGDGTSCSNPTNIPGIPLMIEASGQIVTQDTRLIELVKHDSDSYTYYNADTEKVLTSLRLQQAASEAVLVDLYDAEQREISALKVLPTGYIMFVESTQKSSYWFDDFSDAIRWPGRHPSGTQSNKFAILGADDEFNFTKRSYSLDLSGKTHATLAHTKMVNDQILAVTKQGLSYSVWSIDKDWSLKRLKLKAIGSNSDPIEKVTIPGWSYGGKQIHFTGQAVSLEILNSYFGISQFEISE